MVINKALKVRLYPNKTQLNKINTTLHHCRYIYNEMLARNKKAYKRRGEHLNYNAMQNLLPVIKVYKPWLKEADSQALKYTCRQLDMAYKKFFKHEAGFPRFHKKHGRQSYTTTNMSVVDFQKNKVKLPFLGWVRAMGLRQLPDNAKLCMATISREPDGAYYASISYKYEAEMPSITAVSEKAILGLDYKSDGLYMDSNGDPADMPHWFRENQAKLAKAQRRLSKKCGSRKGERKSSGWRKQHRRVARLQRRVADLRYNDLHLKSRLLADNYDIIGVEALNMRGMSNKGFSNGKATMDNGYGMLVTMLDYKLQYQGKRLIKVDKWYPSSQICSRCGYQNKALKDLKIRKWTCPKCGATHDRDINAAINIKHEAERIIASA